MNADQLLGAYSASVSGRIGHDTRTSTNELRGYGERHFTRHQFLGVFPADTEPQRTDTRSFYIQNTHPASRPGEHWIAVGREPGRPDLVFDSFGRTPGPGWMPHLSGAAVTDTDHNQHLSEDNCGQISLGWGHVLMFHGYDVASQC
jgi:hypothetical protein